MIPLDQFRRPEETEKVEETSVVEADDNKKLSWWERRRQEREGRTSTRDDRVEKRRTFIIERINALTKKFYAVAAKRKWLVFMMALGIAIYFIITSGGGLSFLGIFQKIKGLFF